MDIKAIRKTNVEGLVRAHGGPTAFGLKIERDQVQVSQWLGGKAIGHRLARHIEEKLTLEPGWLDRAQWRTLDQDTAYSRVADGAPPYLSQSQRPDFGMLAAAVFVVHAYLEIRREDPTLVSDPILLETAWQLVIEQGEAVSENNVIDMVKRLSKRIQEREEQHGVEQAAVAGIGRDHGKARR